MKPLIMLVIIFALGVFVCGCSSPATASDFDGFSNSAAEPPAVVERDSPTGVAQSFAGALAAGDADGIKEALSANTLEVAAKLAKITGADLDELLEKGAARVFDELEMPTMRHEKITGAAATVEIKGAGDEKWRTLTFVKERGKWKINLNKFLTNFI